MKSSKLFLGAVFAIGLVIGISGISYAGGTCLNSASYCTDLVIFASDDYAQKLVSVYGYEYGCGQPGRAFTGVLVKSATSKRYLLTGTWNDASQGLTFDITIDKATKTGTGNFAIHAGSYSTFTSDYSQVSCPTTTTAETLAVTKTDPTMR